MSAVTGFNKGDVASLILPSDIARWGTYGELANVPARNLVKHPENISFEVAAASWMQYVTAWGALIEQAKPSTGDFVIVTAHQAASGLPRSRLQKPWVRQLLRLRGAGQKGKHSLSTGQIMLL